MMSLSAVFALVLALSGALSDRGQQAPAPTNDADTTVSRRSGRVLSNPRAAVDCETASRYLGSAVELAQEWNSEYIIVIVRLGRGEKANLLPKRAQAVRWFLKQHSSAKVEVASGEPLGELGLVEIFLSGRKIYSLPVGRNERLRVEGCSY